VRRLRNARGTRTAKYRFAKTLSDFVFRPAADAVLAHVTRWIAMSARNDWSERTTDVIRRALQPGAHCLPLDVLNRYADAVLSPVDDAAAAGHLDACMVCHAEHALLRSFAYGHITQEEWKPVRAIVRDLRQRERLLFDPPSASHVVSRERPLLGSCRLALALAVLLLAAAGGYDFSTSIPPDLGARDLIGGGASRSLAVELVAPHGDQASAPRRLEWRPLNGAVRYRARVMEVDRHDVWSAETRATVVDLPEWVRALVVPEKTLVWLVTAYDAANMPIGESPPERFRLEAKVRE
jgi:hypothetical protein